MDYKKIIKVLFFAVILPGGSALIAYQGVKYGKKKYDDWKSKKSNTDSNETEKVKK